jgi:hypothetical protein
MREFVKVQRLLGLPGTGRNGKREAGAGFFYKEGAGYPRFFFVMFLIFMMDRKV